MKQYLFISLFIILFLINEFYIKNKITKFFKEFNKFSNTIILISSIVTAYLTYKNNPNQLLDLINPYMKKNLNLFIPNSELNKNINPELNKNINPDLNKNTNSELNKNMYSELNKNISYFNLNPNINYEIEKKDEKKDEKKSKRNVSETKKKHVAAQQKWICEYCKKLLDASFEVHHKIPLYLGGDNGIDNLVALCRNCHGKETVKDKVSNEL